jgi:hypothetical protein
MTSSNMLETLTAQVAELISKLEILAKQNATLIGIKDKLETRLAKLENKHVIPASIEPVTTVTTFEPTYPAGFEMPTEDEFVRLEKTVTEKYSQLTNCDYEPSDFSTEFRKAFKALALMRRLDSPHGKRQTVAYLDEARSRARRAGIYGEITWWPFVAAVIAHGDICWSLDECNRFRVTDLGLHLYDGVGRTASNHWRGPLNGSFGLQPNREWKLSQAA